MSGEQDAHLERVNARIGATVLAFCRETQKPDFHMEELMRFVRARIGAAPDSPGRILRDLRQRGAINYIVLNRRASLYRLLRQEVRTTRRGIFRDLDAGHDAQGDPAMGK